MKYRCLVCGGKMKKVGNGYEPWKCTECGARASETYWGGLAFDGSYFDDEDEGDVGCDACGNPAYPKCKDSCPLFDD